MVTVPPLTEEETRKETTTANKGIEYILYNSYDIILL